MLRQKIRSGICSVPAPALAVALALFAASSARCDTFGYSGSPRQIKACVLVCGAASQVLNGNTVLDNATPYAFYVMDSRTDARPAGWQFVNPLAPPAITSAIYTRWQNRQATPGQDPAFNPASPVSQLFKIGAPVTKNLGAYWEVDLDNLSAADLAQFDVILMPYHFGSVLGFTPDEREKLRKYVDAGGTLWLEDEGGFNIPAGAGQFVVDLAFTTTLAGPPVQSSPLHPIFNVPYHLSDVDVLRLGMGAAANRHLHTDPSGAVADPRVLVPIATEAGSPYLSAGDYGAGHLIVSSAGIATDVNSYVGGANVGGEGGNSGAVSGTDFPAALPVDLKVAYDLVAWSTSIDTASGSARRDASTAEHIGADLGRKWATVPVSLTFPAQPLPGVGPYGSGAVIDKGVAFYIDGTNVLRAYNLSPGTDLDNDRNPDEGIVDYLLGAPYDEIWSTDLTTLGTGTTLTTRVSTPTICTVYNTGSGRGQDILTLTNSVGVTMAFDAFPLNANGTLANTSPLLWSVGTAGQDYGPSLIFGSSANTTPVPGPSPVFSDGILFTLEYVSGTDPNNSWRIAPVDPLTGANVFGDPANGLAPEPPNSSTSHTGDTGLGSPIGSLSAGYMRDQTTGAQDHVVWVTTSSSQVTPFDIGAADGVWFGTKRDPLVIPNPALPTQYEAIGNRAHLPWYAPSPAPATDPYHLLPVLHIVTKDPVTGAVTATQDLHYITGDFQVTYVPGGVFRNLIVTLNAPLSANQSVYADYTLDWPGSVVAVSTSSPQPTDRELEQFGGVNPTYGRHYQLFTPNVISNPYYISGTGAFTPQDNLVFTAGDYPAGDRVYAFNGQWNIGADASGQPLYFTPGISWMFYPNDEINIGENYVQPRLINNDPTNGLPIASASADFEAVGSPAYSNGLVYLTGYAHQPSGPDATVILALNANPSLTFSIGQPIPADVTFIRISQIDPLQSANGNAVFNFINQNLQSQNPLSFTVDKETGTFHMLNLYTPTGGFNTALPLYVYVGGPTPIGPIVNPATGYGPLDNLVWYMLIPAAIATRPFSGPTVVGNSLYYTTGDGNVAAVDLPTSTVSGQLHVFNPDGTPRVHVQGVLLDANGNTVPQPIINPPLGTAGTVATGSPEGAAAFDNQITLITDNHRLLEVDHGVNAVVSLDASSAVNVTGGPLFDSSGNPAGGQFTATRVSLSRPNVARFADLNEFLIADTGNNRIVDVDASGATVFEIHSVANDMKFLRPTDPRTLSQPTDVETFPDNGTGLSFTNPATGVTYSYAGAYLAVHYVIADSGNYRILELVDAYGPNGVPIVLTGSDGSSVTLLRQVVYVTGTLAEQNQGLLYRTIQLFQTPDPSNAAQIDTYMATAVSNARPAALPAPQVAGVGLDGSNLTGPGGSLMLIHRYPASGAPFKDGDPAVVIATLAIVDINGNIVRRQPVSNPTWFKEFNVYAPNPNGGFTQQLHYLMADDNGCYDLIPSGTGNDATVVWMLSADDYHFLTGRRLHATSIQRLNQADYYTDTMGNVHFAPHYLITNNYSGGDDIAAAFSFPPSMSGQVHGEVFEIRSKDYYTSVDSTNVFNGYSQAAARLYATDINGNPILNPTSAIIWLAPKETIVSSPAYHIKRTIGSASGGTASYTLEQPTYSSRP